MAPGSVNDSARAMMAAVAKYRDDNVYAGMTGGVVNAYTATTSQGTTGDTSVNISFQIQPHVTNTGPSTMAVDGNPAVPMYISNGVPLSQGDFVLGTCVRCVYMVNAGFVWVLGVAKTASMAALSGLTPAADRVPYYTGATTAAVAPFTAAGRAVVGAADSDAQLLALNALVAKRQSMTQSISAAGALSIDVNLGGNVNISLVGNVTSFSINNYGAGYLTKVTLFISNTGAYSMTGWPGSWAGGVVPTITPGAGKRDTIVLTTSDAGVSWRGFIVAQND